MDFKSLGFEIEKTKDDSPTLRLIDGTERGGESMHHTGGAFSETNYIYSGGFAWAFAKIQKVRILSIGLGLGYVETLAAAQALKAGNQTWELDSFEIVEGLRTQFADFYQGRKTHPVYEEILERTAGLNGVNKDELKQFIAKALVEKRLNVYADLLKFEMPTSHYNVVCHDAFSRKTNPDLWSEDFLNKLLKACDTLEAVVSTYACMGPLKRSLKAFAFQVDVRDGFQGKRNCTRALRSSGGSQVLDL